jgi:hypothetical protein
MARASKGGVIISFIGSDNKELKDRSLSVASSDIFISLIVSGSNPPLEISPRSELLSVSLDN